MPRLLDNPDRDFSANPSNDKIDTGIDENLFTSLIVGYSELSMIRGSGFASEK
jgi:hypothetical protein